MDNSTNALAKVNPKILEHIRASYSDEPLDFQMVKDVLLDADEVYKSKGDRHRWWTQYFVVVDIYGMMIGFDWATSDGDDTAEDKGWEFDPESICEVEPEIITKTIYKRKK